MKRFVIEVESSKAIFFTDIIKNFDFAEIIKVDSIVEPRIYPASGFEIRSGNQTSKVAGKNKNHLTDTNYSHNEDKFQNTVNESNMNLKQIRDAMSAIDRKREEYRK